MASGPFQSVAESILNCYYGGIAPSDVPGSVEVRLWVVMPSTVDGTGGTPATSSAAWPILSVASATAGGVGQIAKALSSGTLLFADMTESSDDIAGFTTHDVSTGNGVWWNDAWPAAAPVSWTAGESPLVPVGAFVADMIPA